MPSREREIFEACLEIGSQDGREAFIRHACGDDTELAARVRALLSAHARADALPSHGGVRSPVEARMPERIGPYRILDRIGEGGMGVVYLGELSQPIRRRVAIKVLREAAGSSQVLARFEAERQALAMMAHPCIARIVYADVTEHGQPYFVMDYVQGSPITDFCDSRNIDVVGRLRLFLQVCSAVRHAHQRGIIHRDLKPSNILVTEEPGVATPKIIDFGVAKATHVRLTERTLHTRMGQAVGTPAYMSPEQADGSSLEVDTRSDVYSLGVVLFELLCGERPHDFGDRVAFREVQRILRDEAPRPPSATVLVGADSGVAARRATSTADLAASLTGDLDAVTLKALAKEPGRRYASVDRLAEDVQRYLDHRPVRARPDTFTYRASRFVRRNRPTVVAAGLVLASLVAGVFAATWQADQARRQAEIAAVARDEARAALYESREISDFLVSLFRLEGGEDDRRAREAILSRGVEYAEQYAGRPHVQALILTGLSRAYVQATEHERAVRLASRAVTTIREVEPNGSATEVRALLGLGIALWAIQAHDSASAVIGRAEEVAEAYLDPGDQVLVEVYSMSATVARTAGRLPEAEARFRRVTEILEEIDPDHPDIPANIAQIGEVRRQAGDVEQAVALFAEALDRMSRVLGDDHPDVLALRLSFADLLFESGIDAARAENLYRSVLADTERTRGPQDIHMVAPSNGLAFLLAAKGELEEAEALMRRSVVLSEAVRGSDNLGTAREWELLARILFDAGKVEEGYRTVEDVLRVKLEVGATAPAIITLREVGRTAVSLGDYDRAEEYAGRLAGLVEGDGADSRWAPEAHSLLGVIFTARGEYERAERELQNALRLAERRPDIPRSIRWTLGDFITLYDAWGEAEKAAEMRRRVAALASVTGEGGPE